MNDRYEILRQRFSRQKSNTLDYKEELSYAVIKFRDDVKESLGLADAYCKALDMPYVAIIGPNGEQWAEMQHIQFEAGKVNFKLILVIEGTEGFSDSCQIFEFVLVSALSCGIAHFSLDDKREYWTSNTEELINRILLRLERALSINPLCEQLDKVDLEFIR